MLQLYRWCAVPISLDYYILLYLSTSTVLNHKRDNKILVTIFLNLFSLGKPTWAVFRVQDMGRPQRSAIGRALSQPFHYCSYTLPTEITWPYYVTLMHVIIMLVLNSNATKHKTSHYSFTQSVSIYVFYI